jgi:SSS family solute:Na+ symporter
VDSLVVIIYLAAMVGFGVWGRFKAHNQEDFLVAGRRLGGLLYTGTMSAVVLGGASTIGGVGLGYTAGLSGMWLVLSIGLGIVALSLFFAPKIQKLEIYTVSQMLELRYGKGSRFVSGAIMTAYGLMISTTSTVAYATVFHALFDLNKVWSVLIGGGIVILYSMLGGMWSITLTDFVQFFIQTIGIFLIMLPLVLSKSGGISELFASLPESHTSPVGIGWQAILGYILIYTLGLLIGQDIWQRVFTARSPGVARWGGFSAGVYCLLYAVAGALIGMAATKIVPGIEVQDDVFVAVVDASMNPGARRNRARRGSGRDDVDGLGFAHGRLDGVPPGHRRTDPRPQGHRAGFGRRCRCGRRQFGRRSDGWIGRLGEWIRRFGVRLGLGFRREVDARAVAGA